MHKNKAASQGRLCVSRVWLLIAPLEGWAAIIILAVFRRRAVTVSGTPQSRLLLVRVVHLVLVLNAGQPRLHVVELGGGLDVLLLRRQNAGYLFLKWRELPGWG